MSDYVGRFAPSPTGLLHAGSLAAALASYLDARAHGGRWLLRIEDLDPPREVPGAAERIVATLLAMGFEPDGEPVRQSERASAYQAAFDRLRQAGWVYPCGCTRREIADSQPGPGVPHHADSPGAAAAELVYPGTCRHGLPPGRPPRSWRVRVTDEPIVWSDRPAGFDDGKPQHAVLTREVGDFVVRRADGPWAYQLAVVVDDAWQGVTDIVRGADLAGSTARQIHLCRLLGYRPPRTLHVPVVLAADGQKLSKQTGAVPVDPARTRPALDAALVHLGLNPPAGNSMVGFWPAAVAAWRRARWSARQRRAHPLRGRE